MPAILVKLCLAAGLCVFCGPPGAGPWIVASRAGLGLEGGNVQQNLPGVLAVAFFDPARPALGVRAGVVVVRMLRAPSQPEQAPPE